MRPRVLVLALAVSLAGCNGELRRNPLMGLLAEGITEPRDRGPLLAFRLPAGGGEAHLYYLPTLSEESWRFDWGPYETKQLVGFSASDDVIYAITTEQYLISLDLETGRTRLVDSAVVVATMDAADRAIVVHGDSTLAVVQNRAVSIVDTLPAIPAALWGGVNGRILALVEQEGARELIVLREDEDPVRQPVPDGDIAVSKWGDMAAVATDSGLVTLSTRDPVLVRFLSLQPTPRLVAFSPSAHEIHLVLGDRVLVTVDRFDLAETRRIPLPGSAAALRPDPSGQKLLIKQEADQAFWVANLDRYRLRSVAGDWDSDLPVATGSGEILGRRGDSLLVLADDSLVALGVSTAPAADRWVVARWEAHQPAHQLSRSETSDPGSAGLTFYVQVSSSRNPIWAEDFARRLRIAGMTALVLQPDDVDELYHVVLGPYSSRREAETVGRSVGLPFWVLTRQGGLSP